MSDALRRPGQAGAASAVGGSPGACSFRRVVRIIRMSNEAATGSRLTDKVCERR